MRACVPVRVGVYILGLEGWSGLKIAEDEWARRASRLDASDGDASRRRIDAVATRIDARNERRRWSTGRSDAGSDSAVVGDGDGGRTRAVCSSSAREARDHGQSRPVNAEQQAVIDVGPLAQEQGILPQLF